MEIYFIILTDRFLSFHEYSKPHDGLDLDGRWHHLLTRYNHDLLSHPKLLQYRKMIEQAGAALDNCWGLIDGTVRPVCRPSENQRATYDGHKRVHSIKFQA